MDNKEFEEKRREEKEEVFSSICNLVCVFNFPELFFTYSNAVLCALWRLRCQSQLQYRWAVAVSIFFWQWRANLGLITL